MLVVKEVTGFVSFVGAGPGDAGLITEKGKQRLREADVILYDRLANPRLLRLTKKSCTLIYCGKLPTKHLMKQEQINAALVEYALLGKEVVRLKGGDPSIFGRVGEEAAALQKHDITYEIVPGVTSSIAAASYAGIPVTHREHSVSVTLRTGHNVEEEQSAPAHAHPNEYGDTIAYYMGVKNLGYHCKELQRKGYSPDTKAAVVEWATTGKQRTVTGTLVTIAEEAEKHRIQNPAMTIIGDVVQLRKELQWFEKKRMFGRRILVAKANHEQSELEHYFLDQGAEAYAFPTLKIVKQELTDSWIQRLQKTEHLVFHAPESVTLLLEDLFVKGYDIRNLPKNIYCLSDKTRKLLQSKGLQAERIKEVQPEMLQAGYRKSLPGEEQNADLLETHTIAVDERFTQIDAGMLAEPWETVVFPNKTSVDWFLQGTASHERLQLKNLPFAYLGESVKTYAELQGFQTIDEEVQQELQQWKEQRKKN